ncbi:MAG: hypothetical protein CVV58_00355 [Tenericutes bacterium HGW-Tenericutes-3]|nr:MAG: hypothetical protein CVV58_00355 [Tenericutes bacterium HGW-Tenericutes-3]
MRFFTSLTSLLVLCFYAAFLAVGFFVAVFVAGLAAGFFAVDLEVVLFAVVFLATSFLGVEAAGAAIERFFNGKVGSVLV